MSILMYFYYIIILIIAVMNDKCYTYSFRLPLYDTIISLYISSAMNESIAEVNKTLTTPMKEVTQFKGAKSLSLGSGKGKKFLMLIGTGTLTRDDLERLLVHESLHLSWYVCDAVGIKLSIDNHEAQAYIIEYIYDRISEFVEDYCLDINE
jgi:hypothetical protein